MSGLAEAQTEKGAQHESCEQSWIWGKMKTAAWDTAPQITLRNCSKEAGGEGQYISFLEFNAKKKTS